MDLLAIVKDHVEPRYLDGHQDKEEVKVTKRVKIFHKQIEKGVREMKVMKYFSLTSMKYIHNELSRIYCSMLKEGNTARVISQRERGRGKLLIRGK